MGRFSGLHGRYGEQFEASIGDVAASTSPGGGGGPLYTHRMVSVLVADLPPATSDFLRRRARRSGAPSVAEHVRHELITLARERDPVDQVVQFVEENHAQPPQPEIDPDAVVLADSYRLPADVWSTLCRRAAASHVVVSDYVHGELVRLARHPTIDDAMWELGEIQAANPTLEIDFDEVHQAMRYTRGLG